MSLLRNRWWTVPGLVLITWAVYAQVQAHDFVNYDDKAYSPQNRHVVKGITRESVAWAFSFESSKPTANWFPLTWLTLMVDTELYGTDAGGFHRTNLLLHTINVLLLLFALSELTGDWAKSAFVAALFAVHPLNVETVAWVSERKGLLSTCFGLITLWSYARFARSGHWKWLVIALATYTMSLMSKQMLVTLPLLLLLLDYWPLKRLRGQLRPQPAQTVSDGPSEREATCGHRAGWRRLLWEKVPFVLIAIVFCFVAVEAQRRGNAIETLERLPVSLRLSNAVVANTLYVRRVFWPVGLSVHYPHPGDSISQVSVMIACLLLCLATIVAYRQRRERPYLLVGWLWFLVALIPVIGVVQIGVQQMADRYAYIPTIGLFIAFTWLLPSLVPAGQWWRTVLLLGSGAVLTGLMFVSSIQASYWWDSVTLFERAVAVTKNNAVAHTNLGEALLKRGHVDAAVEQFHAAIAVDPRFLLAHNNLGIAFINRGQPWEARECFLEALRIAPEYVEAQINLGIAYCLLDDRPRGVQQFRRVLEQRPDNLRAHVCLAWVLAKLGQTEEARKHADYVRAHEAGSVPSLIALP